MTDSSRGISQQVTSNVVTAKTPSVQLDPTTSNFKDALARYQSGVADTLDSVLDWLNNHFAPAPATRSANGRAVTPDDTTLVLADGTTLSGPQQLCVALPASVLAASQTNAALVAIPLPSGLTFSVSELDVYCPAPSAGSGSISLTMGSSIPLNGLQTKVLTTPLSYSQKVPITYTTSSGFSASGVICLTLTVGVLT